MSLAEDGVTAAEWQVSARVRAVCESDARRLGEGLVAYVDQGRVETGPRGGDGLLLLRVRNLERGTAGVVEQLLREQPDVDGSTVRTDCARRGAQR